MVLMRHRCPEQGHDAVAHNLVHRALVAMNCFHHVLEDRVEQLPRLFGVTIGQEFHRALEVREEHRHLLALALQGRFGGQDFLGEVLGGVGLRRCKARLWRSLIGSRPPTLGAELCCRR
jgi:hypothetical protein